MILTPTNKRVIRPYDKPSFEHTQRYGLIKGHPLGPAGGLKFLALLNEGSGNQVIDLSGNNLTGILAGNMFWAAGVHGTVIENPGGVGTDFINLGTNSKLDIFGPNQDFSIIAVVNLDDYGLYGGLFSSGSAAANGIVFGHRQTTGYPNFSSVGNTVAEITATAIGLHQRKQVAITADRDGNLTFYLAAKVIHQADISGTAAENWNRVDDTYKLFTDRSENNPLDGKASQLYLYNRVLTGAELDFLNREPSCMVQKTTVPVYFFIPIGVVREITGTSDAQSAVTGSLDISRKLTGTTDAQSTVTGTLSVSRKLTGTAACASTVSGLLTIPAGGLSDYAELKILNHVVGKTPYSKPTVAIGLCTADPGEDGTGAVCNEVPNTNGYGRVAIPDTDWNVAVGGEIDNTNPIVFPEASGSWGEVTHYALFDSLVYGQGNMIVYDELDISKTIVDEEIVRFSAGQLKLALN